MRKQILVQMDEALVTLLDDEARRSRTNRSEVIRRAVRSWLAALDEARADRQYADAYRRAPEDPAMTEALGRMAAESALPYDD